jgi:hypothetical protein
MQFIANYKDRGQAWERAGVHSARNGAVMRIAPVLIPHLREPSPDSDETGDAFAHEWMVVDRENPNGRAAVAHHTSPLPHAGVSEANRRDKRGAPGGGKSTLASLLSGLRPPESGLVLVGGLDRHSLGADGWRRRVVSAPQFHENHVLTGSFVFNALMGRDWPAVLEDSLEVESVCRGLGLGELLDRMPAGLLQMVGERLAALPR